MTSLRGIVLWNVLNEKLFLYPSHLDDLLGCSSLGNGLRLAHLAPVLFLASIIICSLVLNRSCIRKEDEIRTRAALQALLTIIVPTCSLWSSRYVKLANVLRSRVNVPLEMIIKDMVDGVIEFRNPINDLADLIGSIAVVNAHTICINIGWKWWISCFEWWILAESRSGLPLSAPPRYTSFLSSWLHNDTPTANSSPLGLSLSPFALTSSTSCALLCLDCLPRGSIPSLNLGSKAILEFTAFSPSLRVLSTAQVASAVPFIISDRSRRRPRPLVSVLQQLDASYGPNLVIDSVSNVSAEYEYALHRVHRLLFGEQKVRDTWVEVLGIKAWRRDMFLVALEAALVRLGWIERWAVQVTIK